MERSGGGEENCRVVEHEAAVILLQEMHDDLKCTMDSGRVDVGGICRRTKWRLLLGWQLRRRLGKRTDAAPRPHNAHSVKARGRMADTFIIGLSASQATYKRYSVVVDCVSNRRGCSD